MTTIIWTHATKNISDLKPNPKNPRTITKDNYKILVNNIKRNGYANRLIINTDGVVLCGNQRLKALKELGYTTVDVLIPSETLTDEQIDDITVTDNLSAGAWDFDCLANGFDIGKLAEWGMPPEWLIGEVLEKEESTPVEKKEKRCPECDAIL